MTSDSDRFAATLLGAALGDALGRPVEFLDEDIIQYRYGAEGITEPPERALYTDDTQLLMATARGLLAAEDDGLPAVSRAVTSEYMAWLTLQDSPVHRRAPGVAVIDALQRLRRGMPASTAVDGGANDSIVATRAVAVALAFHGDLPKIISTAAEISRLTHGHPAAVAGGAASAMLVEQALTDTPADEWLTKGMLALKRWCPDDTRGVVEALRTAERAREWSAHDAMEALGKSRPSFGGGWTAEEAVALGLWSYWNGNSDFVDTVRTAANAVGESDSDAIAAIAGALSGATYGLAALPAEWLARLEDASEIEALGRRLYEHRTASRVE